MGGTISNTNLPAPTHSRSKEMEGKAQKVAGNRAQKSICDSSDSDSSAPSSRTFVTKEQNSNNNEPLAECKSLLYTMDEEKTVPPNFSTPAEFYSEAIMANLIDLDSGSPNTNFSSTLVIEQHGNDSAQTTPLLSNRVPSFPVSSNSRKSFDRSKSPSSETERIERTFSADHQEQVLQARLRRDSHDVDPEDLLAFEVAKGSPSRKKE